MLNLLISIYSAVFMPLRDNRKLSNNFGFKDGIMLQHNLRKIKNFMDPDLLQSRII